MKPFFCFLFGAAVCGTVTIGAQSLVSASKVRDLGVRADFFFNGGRAQSVLTREAALATPDWSPKEPLPTSISNVIVAAEAELQRAKDELFQTGVQKIPWEVNGLRLHTYPNTQGKKWYFLVSFQPATTNYVASAAHIHLHVDLLGTPAKIVPSEF